MARALVVAGRIGPAFSGALVEGHGSASFGQTWLSSPMSRANALDVAFSAIEENVTECLVNLLGYYPAVVRGHDILHAQRIARYMEQHG